jgi:hypothetical protein
MKKLLATALAAIGLGGGLHAAPPVQNVDPRTIRFTMPTVAAEDIQFVVPTAKSFEGAPQFHEDEWCQVEFFAASRLPEMKARLAEYKLFEERHRSASGWTEIYARRIARSPVVAGGNAVVEVANVVKATALPAPILTTTSHALGQVKGGYTLRVADSVFLYGIVSDSGLQSLGALVARGGDDQALVRAFGALSKSHELILVDWRSQFVLVGTGVGGKINIWRP